MSPAPVPDDVTALARQALAAEGTPEQVAGVEIRVSGPAKPHARLPEREHAYVEWRGRELHLHAGSFAALLDAHPGVELEPEVEAHVAAALEDADAARESSAMTADEDSLFAQHARFRRGEELPYAWYRGGEPVDDGIWAVDLDLFVEVWLSRHTWDALAGGVVALTLGEDVLEIELPTDADPAEILTLEGAGFFEDEPFEDEPLPPAGDLHVLFFAV